VTSYHEDILDEATALETMKIGSCLFTM